MSVPHQPAARELPRYCLGPNARVAISVAVLLHLLAVLGEPLRMFTQGRQPAAPDAGVVRRTLGPYIDFAYLHHGYFFFAPNPGPSHLMDIRLIDADGSERHLRLPNHRAQWPRLLYHRHFMLSEFLFQLYAPPISPQAVTEGAQVPDDWRRDRALFEHVRSSMEKHLAVRYGAERAEIQLMEHRLPSAVEVFEEHVKLDDEKLYILLPDEVPLAGPTMPAPAGSAVGPSSAVNRTPPVSQPTTPTPMLPHQTSEEVKP
ncbi:MAG: hypothetical protein IT423_01210 [Pirellulaceae bacterium]|nr:hypothetical protein [Pirellulaceae bacterium]